MVVDVVSWQRWFAVVVLGHLATWHLGVEPLGWR